VDYKAVLFDLDGTLLDTLEDLAAAGNRVLGDMGLPEHPVDAYRYFVGDGINVLAERILPAPLRSPETIAAAVAAFQAVYARNWNDRSAPYEGVPAMLDQLIAAGLRLCILSNKPDAFTRLCVEQLLPHWSFDPLLGQRPGVPKKPDPAGALEVAARLGLAPAEILYVGDTAVDMRTGVAAGMDAVGVLWGFRGAEELRQAGAWRLISRPDELLPLLSTP
jgi:phosphoglycolate phosphatase